jgi:FkbM family methyltransferase
MSLWPRRLIPATGFEPVGWWDSETVLKFYAPRNPAHVSRSAVNLQSTTEFFSAPVDTVHALAERSGDQQIDLIKMDVEGAEYRVLRSLIALGPCRTCSASSSTSRRLCAGRSPPRETCEGPAMSC